MSLFIYILNTGLVVLVSYLVNRYVKNRRFWELVNDFYGDRTLPLIGNAHQFGTTTEDFLKDCFEIFKRANYTTYKFLIGNKVFINLCEPETVEILLSSNKEINKMEDYSYLKHWLGDGLLLSSGAKWRKRRKFITKTFHFKILDQFIKVFNDNGKILLEQLSQQKETVFNIYPFINRFTLDVICESAMGVSINAQTDINSDYVKAVHSECLLMNERFMSAWKRIFWLYKFTNDYKTSCKNIEILHSLTNKVITARKEILRSQNIENKETQESHVDSDGKRKLVPFLDLLLLSEKEDGGFYTDEDIREETDTFMFGGHDTTTSAISFAIFALANNPQIQQKVFDEIVSVMGSNPNLEITSEHIQQLKYFDMFIKESLRLYPSVPGFGRHLENDLELPDGKIVPAGCSIIVDTFAMFRNPKYFNDPENFDPERFSPDNVKGRHPYLFTPFSAGPRNCIGQKFAMLEIKCTLSKILLNFEIISGGEGSNVRLASEIILKSINGVNVILKDRIFQK